MSQALGSFHSFYYNPVGNVCPVVSPLLSIEGINYGGCGPDIHQPSYNQCCSHDAYRMADPSYGSPSLCLQDGLGCDDSKLPPGFNTSTTPRPNLGDIVYGAKIVTCTVNDTIALTYDDGPSPYTHDLLDILKANDIKATFFLTNTRTLSEDVARGHSKRNPTVMKRIYNEGHQIAGHTWAHKDLNLMLDWELRDDMIKMEMAFTDILGFFPTYMRPPFNNCDLACQKQMGKLGYHVIGWDIDTEDWMGNYTFAEGEYLKRIQMNNREQRRARISLAHDTHNGTVHGFTQFTIDNARKHGYKLVTLGECLGDPEENWYRDPLTGNKLVSLPPREAA